MDDVSRLRADLNRSSLGKLANDDQVKPILSEFYGSLVRNVEQLQEAIGLNLDELLSIPNGEFALAVFPNNTGRAEVERQRDEEENSERVNVRIQGPAIAVLLDAGEEIASVQILLQRMDQEASKNMVHEEKTIDRLTLHRYQNPNRRDQRFGYFLDDSVIVACTDPDFLELLADKWLGRLPEAKTMADNRRFTQIMARCVGTEGERPQVTFYADPMGIIRQFTPRNAGTSMFLAMLPALGLDGIQGVGGSWIVSPPDFDAISHFHILLGSPRRELLALLRPKSGSTTPEQWVPDTVAGYSTINWDLAATLQGIERLYDQFRGEDAFEQEIVQRFGRQFDIDLRQDVLDNLEGRITLLQGFVRPIRINSGSNVYAVRLKNPQTFEDKVLPKILDRIEDRTNVQLEAIGPIKAHVVEVGRRLPEDSAIRRPEICIAMIDDYVVVSDSRYMMQQLAGCLNGTAGPLVDSLEFQLISDRITAQLQGQECAGLSFARPEESLQLFYELARDPKNRERLRQVADNNPVFQALLSALEKHELPPFAVISKYLAPSGSYLVDEETGLHTTSFTLRRE
ncbi:MAG: hypothetical protein D6753_03135 [Planctomycetota bacterium]|nr:MAG: hypothetical protein D6753_03135 [Planctomycetota bacterium]